MREAALIAAAVAAALPVAAKARDAAVYHKEGPLRGSLLRNEPAPVYSTDPQDPWNRLFHLLYARKLHAQVGPPEHSKAPWSSITRLGCSSRRISGTDSTLSTRWRPRTRARCHWRGSSLG